MGLFRRSKHSGSDEVDGSGRGRSPAPTSGPRAGHSGSAPTPPAGSGISYAGVAALPRPGAGHSGSAPPPGSRAGSSGSAAPPPAGPGDGHSGSAPPGYTPPDRTHTNSSHYSFDGIQWIKNDPDAQTWMYAREARAQQAGLPAGRAPPGTKYPSATGTQKSLNSRLQALGPVMGLCGFTIHLFLAPQLPGPLGGQEESGACTPPETQVHSMLRSMTRESPAQDRLKHLRWRNTARQFRRRQPPDCKLLWWTSSVLSLFFLSHCTTVIGIVTVVVVLIVLNFD
ncbi:hypothetical protein SODALDRAFT_76625 [Sodiomyces alkalinus F11]|uniref:Uncharacterized protein n=1 Tax=Sodiomyces alkalinus (strain CBS 110278 / VKM F-3762 / F11) TaxID=1314773 RepID=A0A3N2PKJ0_SODAK|nr:hypothetical protein SODALDRAFT_76625 [Sodiomyces alkalinus F11]ROT35025.1 hypothetical protein SODALDRAFT_76625 [Sodiomyces alkalinus F11]